MNRWSSDRAILSAKDKLNQALLAGSLTLGGALGGLMLGAGWQRLRNDRERLSVENRLEATHELNELAQARLDYALDRISLVLETDAERAGPLAERLGLLNTKIASGDPQEAVLRQLRLHLLDRVPKEAARLKDAMGAGAR